MPIEEHYRTLGVSPDATPAEIKSAYRKLVLAHHPDRDSSANGAEVFRASTEAWEVLRDPDRRKHYDFIRSRETRRIMEEAARRVASPPTPPRSASPRQSTPSRPTAEPKGTQPKPPAPVATIPQELTHLQLTFNRGQAAEAERIALALLDRDYKLALPHAILGDIARSRGKIDEALKRYAFAAQYDPAYGRRYEEMLASTSRRSAIGSQVRPGESEDDPRLPALGIGGLLILVAAAYVALTRETPLMPSVEFLSTFTLGAFVMLFLSGVVLGASLSAANVVDRFVSLASNALGRPTPTLALATVAAVSFPAAAGLYVGLGVAQKRFDLSTSRMLIGASGVVLLFTLAAALSPSLSAGQVALWGGNLVYLGAIAGWTVADSLKRS